MTRSTKIRKPIFRLKCDNEIFDRLFFLINSLFFKRVIVTNKRSLPMVDVVCQWYASMNGTLVLNWE